jgi:hypothetical protein
MAATNNLKTTVAAASTKTNPTDAIPVHHRKDKIAATIRFKPNIADPTICNFDAVRA